MPIAARCWVEGSTLSRDMAMEEHQRRGIAEPDLSPHKALRVLQIIAAVIGIGTQPAALRKSQVARPGVIAVRFVVRFQPGVVVRIVARRGHDLAVRGKEGTTYCDCNLEMASARARKSASSILGATSPAISLTLAAISSSVFPNRSKKVTASP